MKTIVTRIIIFILLIILPVSYATYERSVIWEDEITLWKDIAAKSSNKARGHDNLGIAYEKIGYVDDAIREHRLAIKLNPHNPNFYNNLGIAYMDINLLGDAIKAYLTALNIEPYNFETRMNLGIAYRRKELFDDAIREFKIALSIKPNNKYLNSSR